MLKRITTLLLALAMLVTMFQMVPSAAGLRYGDPNNDNKVDATDALFALRVAVGKATATDQQYEATDVDDSQKVDAVDALMILQYAVKIIDVFLVEMDPESRYYNKRDTEYKVNYSDFEDEIVTLDSLDAAELVEKLGDLPDSAPVEGYGVTQDNKLSYTPLSNEATRLGQVSKYNKANSVTKTLRAGSTVVEYSIPTAATAYDAVPIAYKVYSTDGKNFPIHLEATAFEDPDRYTSASPQWLDANLPGKVAIEMAYEGYVNGTRNGGTPVLNKDPDQDVQGTKYPSYSTTDLIKSGTIATASYCTWFKFTFKNTGNTILDGEGNSAFRFMPTLYKSNGAGGWTSLGGSPNVYYPMLDYVYPGESGEMWCMFNSAFTLQPGEYKIVISGCLRNEQDTFDFATNQVAGKTVTTSTFEFSVTKDGAMTTPKAMTNTSVSSIKRNNWLGNFEEFMSSYTTMSRVGDSAENAREGVLYVQPAPWTKQIVLKVINGNSTQFACAHLPIDIETDSIKLNLNPYNPNWVLTEDGTREPMVITQMMPDMRGNVDRGPYCDLTVLNEIRNMKEAGVNALTSTHAYTGDYTGLYDMVYFALDCARKMNFDYEGHCLYYYRGGNAIGRVKASDSTIDLGSGRDMFNLSGEDAANGILAKWNLIRYGDFYVYNPITKVVPIAIEENYGWMTYNLQNRYGINNSYSDRLLYNWLQEAYDNDIDALNDKYGTDFDAFKEIKISDQGYSDGVATKLNGTLYGKTWTASTYELDLFRTAERMRYYKEMLKFLDVENTQVYLRSENGIFLAPGISPTTTNPHYRNIFYEQRYAAAIPEILAASGIVYGDSGYSHLPLNPSEVYELTRQAAKAGFNSAKTPGFAHGTDYVINDYVGTYDFSDLYNTGELQKGCAVNRNYSVFTYFKAMYEAGGTPGIMWMDYNCDLYVTSTQFKELQFFQEKVKEMLATKEGKEWATNIPAEQLEHPLEDVAKGAYSYPEEYIENAIANLPRVNGIMDYVTNKN